ncbi:MAG: AAA family ATPase [Campylobacter sp.]
MNKFKEIKELFITDDGFINLSNSSLAYKKLLNFIDGPGKIAVIYGKAGSGKSFLLHKISKDNKKILYFSQPFFNENDFFKELFLASFGYDRDFYSYEEFLRICIRSKDDKNTTIVLLDEAGFYPKNLLDKTRLLADSGLFKFVFALHQEDQDGVFKKEYFKTRISDLIYLEELEASNVSLYIEKKLGEKNFHERCAKFTDEHFLLITKLTNGNLRQINKLMYKFFEIYEYYEQNNPSKISGETMNSKIIEMAAIACGVIDD